MNAEDRLKVKRAGFRIFRQRRIYPIDRFDNKVRNEIWELSDKGSWCKYQDYPSQAAMERAWKDLMKDKKNIGED
jgi:hypothetical protein